jgi:predicted helicase
MLDNSGIKTHRDNLVIAQDENELQNNIKDFYSQEIPDQDLLDKIKFKPTKNWNLESKRKGRYNSEKVKQIAFRPFDNRFIYYDVELIDRARENIAHHILEKNNYCLVFMRQYAFNVPSYCYISVVNSIIDNRYFISNKGMCQIAPLYLYQSDLEHSEIKNPNLNPKIYSEIKKILPSVTPECLFDYIYAVLHSLIYRQRYGEFLKSDFPRIPYPSDNKTFHVLAEKGEELRRLHLMVSDTLDELVTTYPQNGDNTVINPRYESGNVYINESQYFGGVPSVAWEFYIGGYQPAQKWLKDRKGRTLSVDDIMHYQRVIVALTNTEKIMQQIDSIDFLPKDKK